jgi:hypothetical protein
VLGVRFDTAGGARHDETYTCVLGQEGHPFPDLTLAMSATDADELIFRATLTPSNATAVPDLGRIAYQVGLPATTTANGIASGPRTEIGWLSSERKVLWLRYTHPRGWSMPTSPPLLPSSLPSPTRSRRPSLVLRPRLSSEPPFTTLEICA